MLLAVVVLAVPAFAQQAIPAGNCLANEDATIAKHINSTICTAQDVKVAEAVNPRGPDGKPIATCFANTTFSFIADFQVVTNATTRYNVGLYMATGGQGTALTGSCVDNIISPLHDPGQAGVVNCVQGGTGTQCLGSALYHEVEAAPDNCGDTESADGTNQFITIAVNNIVCPPLGTQFTLPNCTTWETSGQTTVCTSSPSAGWPYNNTAIAGSTSKCNCSSIFIPITPISYSMTVAKSPSPASMPEPGGNFTYTVGVTNTTTTGGAFGSEIINQLCDDKYGNIATTGACSGGSNAGTSCANSTTCGGGACVLPPACPKPTNCPASLCTSASTPFPWCTGPGAGTPSNGDSCATSVTCALPTTVASGATVNNLCTFNGSFTGQEGTLLDTVTVSGFGNTGQASPPPVTGNASATVTLSEGPAKAQVLKSLDSGHACATVRYKVEVDNTSDNSTDEAETLSALIDTAYGDITTVGGNVLGTTCGVASGAGSLAGTAGAGTLPKTIQPGSNYTCEFDGQFCAALGTAGSSCASGLEHINQVNATLVDDNSEGHALTSYVAKTLTVDVCFTSSSQ